MNTQRQWYSGAAMLVPIFLGHSVILLFLEPAMGFKNMADFFDLAKVVPALGSAAWFVSNMLHIALGTTLLLFQSELRQPDATRRDFAADCCLAAAPLFVVVGMSGFVGEALLNIMQANSAGRDAALYGLLAVRTMVLIAGVALLGLMILSVSLRKNMAKSWLRLLGLPIGLAALLFVLVPTPAPVLLFVWFLAFNFGRQ